jgi:predicted hotdog family 3-hydroxylacyl-ACP dehydratase
VLNRDAIAGLLPHGGKMVLLDRVQRWTEDEITCLTGSHRWADNPLRRNAGLSTLCGVEYGAQAMALHGALVSGDGGGPGVLASLRKVRCHVARLDDIPGDLTVAAKLLIAQRGGFIYGFSLRAAERLLLDGQAAVFLT